MVGAHQMNHFEKPLFSNLKKQLDDDVDPQLSDVSESLSDSEELPVIDFDQEDSTLVKLKVELDYLKFKFFYDFEQDQKKFRKETRRKVRKERADLKKLFPNFFK